MEQRKMISLIGEDFSVKITEDNPVYNTLKKFSGETVLIYDTPEIKKNNKNEEIKESKTKKETLQLDNNIIFKKLYEEYPELLSTEEDKKIPVWLKLIENHVLQIIGSEHGKTTVEKIGNGTYKKGDLFLYMSMPAHFD
jgi:hypothetical protein